VPFAVAVAALPTHLARQAPQAPFISLYGSPAARDPPPLKWSDLRYVF
jgi:hypothetical protein